MTSETENPPHIMDGVISGILGMIGFSGTLVATRMAVADFSPVTVTASRIVVAGMLGLGFLVASRRLKLPSAHNAMGIISMGLGLAVGYPFFLALALTEAPAVHGAVVTGLAPAATAIIFVARGGQPPTRIFWVACTIGFLSVLYFAYDAGGGRLSPADGWLLLALFCVAFAYVEGGRVSGELGGTATLSWAMLFLTLPALGTLLWSTQRLDVETIALSSWLALAYLGFISMFLASVFWYRGLAKGGVARIGQINLLLPLVALAWSSLFLGEKITLTAIVCAIIVFLAMVVCLKSRT